MNECKPLYIGTVEMEAVTMVDMINQHVIPSCKKAEINLVKKLEASVTELKKSVGEAGAYTRSHSRST